MDITRFINSKDIAEHFKTAFHEEDYADLPLRYAWLIWQSRNASIEEKHGAWQELIDTYPDMELPSGDGLHDFLRRCMAAEDRLLSLFYAKEPDTTYFVQARIIDRCFGILSWEADYTLYPDFESCLAGCSDWLESREPLGYVVRKHWPAMEEMMKVYLSPEGKPTHVEDGSILNPDEKALFAVFPTLCFDFPLPFQKGDLVCAAKVFSEDSKGYKPFVLDRIECAEAEAGTQMTAYGYYARRDGHLYGYDEPNCMNLIYHTTDLTPGARVLKGISSYLTGRIGLMMLLNSNHLLRLDTKAWELAMRFNCTHEEYELCAMTEIME